MLIWEGCWVPGYHAKPLCPATVTGHGEIREFRDNTEHSKPPLDFYWIFRVEKHLTIPSSSSEGGGGVWWGCGVGVGGLWGSLGRWWRSPSHVRGVLRTDMKLVTFLKSESDSFNFEVNRRNELTFCGLNMPSIHPSIHYFHSCA